MTSAIKDREIAARGEAGEIGEADLLALFGKMVKQRQGKRQGLCRSRRAARVGSQGADRDRGDLGVSAAAVGGGGGEPSNLPPAIAEVSASSIKDMGKVMGVLKAKYTGQMDFGAVGALIKAQLG